MSHFYAPHLQLGLVPLPSEEQSHMTKSFRLGQGHTVQLTDGKGMLATGTMQAQGKQLAVQVHSLQQVPRPAPLLHLAVGIVKQADRLEWLLEKAVELGVAELTFVACARSQRHQLRHDRLLRLALAALKQCRSAYLPAIHISSFPQWLMACSQATGHKCIAHLAGPTQALRHCLPPADTPLWAAVGPEGDFDAEEIDLALQAGLQPVALGQAILRTETAGLYIAALNYERNEMDSLPGLPAGLPAQPGPAEDGQTEV